MMNIILGLMLLTQVETPAAQESTGAGAGRILVVYYSRSGTTARIGRELAQALGADTEMIRDTRSRAGFFGWMRSGYEATTKVRPAIQPIEKDPANYDLVVLGTPVWAGTMASPMRTYIYQNHEKFKSVAFFCTQGAKTEQRAFKDMAALCGAAPVATLSVQHDVVVKGNYRDRLEKFVASAREEVGR
jgi:flavodoxin